MASQRKHNHLRHLVEPVLRLLLLPIVIGGTDAVPQIFSGPLIKIILWGNWSNRIDTAIGPLMFIRRREIQKKRVDLTNTVFYSVTLGAGM